MKLYQFIKNARVFAFIAIGISVQAVFAQAPQGLNYQAVARDLNGNIIANHSIGLRLTITNTSGGSVLYRETQTATTNQFGLFTINLGSGTIVTGNFSSISWGTVTPWLQVEMDPTGGTTYANMGTSQLLSVPYALFAASGTQGPAGATWYTGAGVPSNGTGVVNDLYLNTTNSSYYKKTGASTWTLEGTLAVNGGTGGGTLDSAYNFGGPGAGRIITANNGSVEVDGSTNNAAAFTATTSANGVAILANSSSASSTYPTIQASSASSSTTASAIIGDATGAGVAVAGQVESTGTAHSAVLGNNLRTAGGSGVEADGFNGLDGEAYNVLGFGAYGNNNDASSGTRTGSELAAGVNGIGFVGTLGQTINDDGAGVLGTNLGPTRDGTYDNGGVEGQGFIGVVGKTNTAGTFGSGGGAGLGSYGDLIVIGNITATGGKSFMIDDPLDPANKFLKHFCIESNEVLNMYRGSVLLDANGEATVELPAYFASINKNFTYQLTSIGQPGPSLYIKSEIANNKFTIAGGAHDQKVSWEVVAERNDPYFQQHPEERANEIVKRPAQVGKYMHPLEYGKTEKDGILFRSPVEGSVHKLPNAKPSVKSLNLSNSDNKVIGN